MSPRRTLVVSRPAQQHRSSGNGNGCLPKDGQGKARPDAPSTAVLRLALLVVELAPVVGGAIFEANADGLGAQVVRRDGEPSARVVGRVNPVPKVNFPIHSKVKLS